MRRPSGFLAALLAVLLSWQAATAAAHCLRAAIGDAAAGGAVMEICGPDGLRLVPLTDDPAPHDEAVCAVCHLLPGLALAAPDGLAVPVMWTVPAEVPHPAPPHGHPAARAPPYRPTGPPSLL